MAIAKNPTAATTPSIVGSELPAPTAYATSKPRHTTAALPAAARIGSQRRSVRDNVLMPGVSQALLDFAHNYRAQPGPGVEVIATPRYHITLMPDFPIPGPNNVTWIRCRADETDDVIREARATIAPYRLPVMWTLDPGTEPSDFAEHLARHGILPNPHGSEFAVMVLPGDTDLESPPVPGLEFVDPLVDLATFRALDAVAAEAFASVPFPAPFHGTETENPEIAMLERRRLNFIKAGNRRFLLATIDGEPAGSSNVALFPPAAATVNGGSVRPKFRGRGIYRAMVAERLKIARDAGVDGLCVWGGDMSRPILAKLGFEKVSWRRFYLDAATADSS
jgi:GNAT superfamily N-acetyltransferase